MAGQGCGRGSRSSQQYVGVLDAAEVQRVEAMASAAVLADEVALASARERVDLLGDLFEARPDEQRALGVSVCASAKRDEKYTAVGPRLDGNGADLGCFRSMREAARAYDDAAFAHFRECVPCPGPARATRARAAWPRPSTPRLPRAGRRY